MTSTKIILKVLENIGGPMAESTMDNGSIIKWKDTVLSPGLMAENTSENIKTIRNIYCYPYLLFLGKEIRDNVGVFERAWRVPRETPPTVPFIFPPPTKQI